MLTHYWCNSDFTMCDCFLIIEVVLCAYNLLIKNHYGLHGDD